MVQKSQTTTFWMYSSPVLKNGINYQSLCMFIPKNSCSFLIWAMPHCLHNLIHSNSRCLPSWRIRCNPHTIIRYYFLVLSQANTEVIAIWRLQCKYPPLSGEPPVTWSTCLHCATSTTDTGDWANLTWVMSENPHTPPGPGPSQNFGSIGDPDSPK